MTFKLLDDDMQISDDFSIFYDDSDGYYYAVRADTEQTCHFAIKHKSYWLAITQAVETFQRALLAEDANKTSQKLEYNVKTDQLTWQ